jgi:hypothetical protein
VSDLYVPIRGTLFQHPKVLIVATMLKANAAQVIGYFAAIWNIEMRHGETDGEDGIIRHYNAEVIDAMTCPGFAKAAAVIGWIVPGDNGVRLPGIRRQQKNIESMRTAERDKKRLQRAKSKIVPEVSQGTTRGHSRDLMSTDIDKDLDRDKDKQQQHPKFWTGPHRFHPDAAAVAVLCQFGMEERAATNVCSYIDAAEVERAVRYCRANGLRPGFIVKRVSEGAAKPWNAPDATTDLIAAAVAALPPSAFTTAKEQAHV